uniref:Uncharacterized protein n=1 Tax=Anguilla anguilla TaxID=7936 RepID=A0A0E9TGP8_ANGAN
MCHESGISGTVIWSDT